MLFFLCQRNSLIKSSKIEGDCFGSLITQHFEHNFNPSEILIIDSSLSIMASVEELHSFNKDKLTIINESTLKEFNLINDVRINIRDSLKAYDFCVKGEDEITNNNSIDWYYLNSKLKIKVIVWVSNPYRFLHQNEEFVFIYISELSSEYSGYASYFLYKRSSQNSYELVNEYPVFVI